MITNKNCGQENQDLASADSLAEAHARIALEQSALYAAQLAISRWSKGSLPIHAPVYAFDQVSARERWYAQVQNNFQDWLARGGFSQTDLAEPVAPVCALPLSAPILRLPQPDSDTQPSDACVD